MVDVGGLELNEEDRQVLSHPQVGGVILGLHGRNYASLLQLQDLVRSIRECNENLLVAVDQEGGRVQRFQKQFTRLPPMHVFGEVYAHEPERAIDLAHKCGWLMAAEVLSCGLDISFAPVLDLYNRDSRIIADRAFGASASVVSELARAFVAGMHDAGMKATGKHFPGHGSVLEDSHVELPVDDRSLKELQATDLLPFAQCGDVLDAVMPGHVVYPQVDRHCAALSRIWLQDILRQQLGFTGVVFSDDLTMAAAESAGNVVQRAELALHAGCDMILVCNNRVQALEVIDWLESCDYPGNDKLISMRGETGIRRDRLRETGQWQQSSALISNLLTDSVTKGG
ncbi:MAG: beta-N-acetylhexosaminidase [Gammaproteobacteria bacterium]|nr:beta-N-acetylhexosaminidase [Gammaproteobacteria bacterium]